MSIETLLERFNSDFATLQMLKREVQDIEESIIDDSSPSSGERVQSSSISDSTADKALKIISLTEEINQRIQQLEGRVNATWNGVLSLSDLEFELIDRRYFRSESLSKIEKEMKIPLRTLHRKLNAAKDKIRQFTEEFIQEDI